MQWRRGIVIVGLLTGGVLATLGVGCETVRIVDSVGPCPTTNEEIEDQANQICSWDAAEENLDFCIHQAQLIRHCEAHR